jgi:hypothetical protein
MPHCAGLNQSVLRIFYRRFGFGAFATKVIRFAMCVNISRTTGEIHENTKFTRPTIHMVFCAHLERKLLHKIEKGSPQTKMV